MTNPLPGHQCTATHHTNLPIITTKPTRQGTIQTSSTPNQASKTALIVEAFVAVTSTVPTDAHRGQPQARLSAYKAVEAGALRPLSSLIYRGPHNLAHEEAAQRPRRRVLCQLPHSQPTQPRWMPMTIPSDHPRIFVWKMKATK